MKKILVTLGCLVLTCLCAFAGLKNWSSYTNHDMVLCMLNDGNHLWVGTNGGLVRLDKETGGKQFYNRSNGLPTARVSALATDSKGTLWTSSENGIISSFNGTGFDILETTEANPGNTSHANYALAVDELDRIWYGALWVYQEDKETGEREILGWEAPNAAIAPYIAAYSYLFTEEGEEDFLYIGGDFFSGDYLLKFDGKTLTPILTGEITSAVMGMAKGEDGSLWLATSGNGLLHYAADGTLTAYNTSNSDIPDNNLHDIQTDHEGNYWLACGCSLVKYDGKQFTTYRTDLISENKSNFISKVIPEDDGTVWVGTKWQGLFKFAGGTFAAVNINPTSSMSDNQMGYSMCMDKEGNIWNAGRQELLKIDRNNEWHSLFKLDYESLPTSFRIQAVGCDPQGNVWVALSMSDTCVVKMSPEGEVIEAFTQSEHPALAAGTQRESCFAFDLQGNVWWGAYAALYKYDGKNWEYYTTENSPIPCNAINDLDIDSKGVLWGCAGFLGSKGGLFRLEGSTWTTYTTENSDIPTSFPVCLDIDSEDRVWLHCRDEGGYVSKDYGSGLTCFNGNTWTSYTTENSDIPSNTIWDITIDKYNRIWLGTAEAGLACLDGTVWTNYNTDNSDIASDQVSCILVDEYRNRIWMNHLYSGGISSAEFDGMHAVGKVRMERNVQVRTMGTSLLCTSPTAVRLEVYTLDAVKVGEATFSNGEAKVQVSKTPATYLYIVTYPDGHRESGKVMVK